MFKVTQTDTPVDYSVDACFVRLAENGCYVPCEQDEADGVCVKKHVTNEVMTPAEDGTETPETVSSFEDVVYRFGEGLNNTEPICGITEHSDEELFAEFKDDAEETEKLKTALSILSTKRLKERYPVFEAGQNYAVGTLLMYGGSLFTVLQAHTSQEDWTPTAAPSLFAQVLSSQITGDIQEWVQPDSTNPYMTGDKVIFNGVTYESVIDNNVWSPADYAAGWTVAD